MTKTRTSVPDGLAADARFASDNTCCVCGERGKAVQLHHIDEDPSNNVEQNLALLCLECHNNTQLHGGFGRRLDVSLVVRFRDAWLIRVARRREKADQDAVSRQVPEPSQKMAAAEAHVRRDPPLNYIKALPAIRAELLKQSRSDWEGGSSAEMAKASYGYIDALQGVLVALAQYYSPKQFGEKSAQEFFADAIAARFDWHRAHGEPAGPGTGGTIVNAMCAGDVMADVERMVEEFALSLISGDATFDWNDWRARWRA